MEELTDEALEQFMAGYFAAMRGEPYWPHNTDEWRDGFAFFQLSRNKATQDEPTCH